MKYIYQHIIIVLALLAFSGVPYAIEMAPGLAGHIAKGDSSRSLSDADFAGNVEYLVPGEVFEDESLSDLSAQYDDVEYWDNSSFVDIRSESGWGSRGAGYDGYGNISGGGAFPENDLWEDQVWGASGNLSVSDVMDSEAIAQKWGSLQSDVRGIGKSIRSTIGAQLDEIRGLVGADLLEREQYQRRALNYGDSGRDRSGRNASQMNSYGGDEYVPFIYRWFYKLITFKNENPAIFYSILIFVIFLLVIQSMIVGLMGRGRRRAF
ncbi:hypothetical protein BTA51_12815 [Hahella sp. CCB-MM4]|uniref:hypothetical protein n=1 Tax=Hahella sp. (strain CCB-MM4) TaxID=1926491 RepID=UPI000B9BA661|nr:hypothetical protein [Hahella sp. CCB-MM4]OZG72851.1 hypothetical protein BTA51_12815 [Hahella sp. CCB-MM4]